MEKNTLRSTKSVQFNKKIRIPTYNGRFFNGVKGRLDTKKGMMSIESLPMPVKQ